MASDTPRDAPWVMRTYSGHSSARASNELYRTNLAKGQTGLSIAFDLPTQTGYDPDAPEAAGEVGKVGVPVAHLGHMRELLDGIPVAEMNTSMTINATAPWLLGLYLALFVAPPDYQQGEAVRIMFVHVPAAWMASLVYALMAAASAASSAESPPPTTSTCWPRYCSGSIRR